MDKSLWKAHVAFRRVCNLAAKDKIDQNTAIVFKTLAAFISEHHRAGMDSTKELNKLLTTYNDVKQTATKRASNDTTDRDQDAAVHEV
jgi:hypothetical protein